MAIVGQGVIPVIRNGYEEVALELLDLEEIKIETKDENGASFLHLAAENRMPQLVHKLIKEKNFSVTMKDFKNRTPLHYLQTNKNGLVDKVASRIIKDLFKSGKASGFRLNNDFFKDKDGKLPCPEVYLYWKCLQKHPEEDVDIEYIQELVPYVECLSSGDHRGSWPINKEDS